jgi:hypothetical protein
MHKKRSEHIMTRNRKNKNVVSTIVVAHDNATSSSYSYVATRCRELNLNPKCVRATLRRKYASHELNTRWNVGNDEIERVILECASRANARRDVDA